MSFHSARLSRDTLLGRAFIRARDLRTVVCWRIAHTVNQSGSPNAYNTDRIRPKILNSIGAHGVIQPLDSVHLTGCHSGSRPLRSQPFPHSACITNPVTSPFTCQRPIHSSSPVGPLFRCWYNHFSERANCPSRFRAYSASSPCCLTDNDTIEPY